MVRAAPVAVGAVVLGSAVLRLVCQANGVGVAVAAGGAASPDVGLGRVGSVRAVSVCGGAGAVRGWQRLADAATRTRAEIKLPDLSVFQRWAPSIRRFSYLLSPLNDPDG
jgi:hypothetical protein